MRSHQLNLPIRPQTGCGLSGSAWFAGCLQLLHVLIYILQPPWADKAPKAQCNQTKSSFCLFSFFFYWWMSGSCGLVTYRHLQKHTDNNVCIMYTSHGSWIEWWRFMDGTGEVTCDWRRLLLKKAWETAKQALPLVTWFSLPFCPVQFCSCRDWF